MSACKHVIEIIAVKGVNDVFILYIINVRNKRVIMRYCSVSFRIKAHVCISFYGFEQVGFG